MIGITGVSGSGKSTLINETLYPILNAHFYHALKKPMPYKQILGLEHIDKAIDIRPITPLDAFHVLIQLLIRGYLERFGISLRELRRL